MPGLTRRSVLRMAAGISLPVEAFAAPQQKRLTKDELQRQLKAVIVAAARESHAEFAASGETIVTNWTRRGADRLVDEQSDANVARATGNARLCGQAIAEATVAEGNKKAGGALILGVFQRLCPLYPFC